MRNVAIWLCMQAVLRLTINLLQLAVVYLVARVTFATIRHTVRWSFKLVTIVFNKALTSTRRAKAKAKKLATTIPPPAYPHQHFSSLDQTQFAHPSSSALSSASSLQFGQYSLLDTIPESPLESEMSEVEDSSSSSILIG